MKPAVLVLSSAAIVASMIVINAGGVNARTPRATPTLLVSGLNNPRGLTFGPDGALYIAEGGLGGSDVTTPSDCEQVPAPVGPYSGGFTSRITRVEANGTRTIVADGLPSSQTSPALGSLVSGVADVTFLNGQLYAIEAGAGCSLDCSERTTKCCESMPTGRRRPSSILALSSDQIRC